MCCPKLCLLSLPSQVPRIQNYPDTKLPGNQMVTVFDVSFCRVWYRQASFGWQANRIKMKWYLTVWVVSIFRNTFAYLVHKNDIDTQSLIDWNLIIMVKSFILEDNLLDFVSNVLIVKKLCLAKNHIKRMLKRLTIWNM